MNIAQTTSGFFNDALFRLMRDHRWGGLGVSLILMMFEKMFIHVYCLFFM